MRLWKSAETEVGDHTGAENQAVGRPAELEVPELLAFSNVTAPRDVFVNDA